MSEAAGRDGRERAGGRDQELPPEHDRQPPELSLPDDEDVLDVPSKQILQGQQIFGRRGGDDVAGARPERPEAHEGSLPHGQSLHHDPRGGGAALEIHDAENRLERRGEH